MSIILGIETSCDETAASVVRYHENPSERILSNVILSQMDMHKKYGGVVPEIAARAHLDHIEDVVKTAVEESNIELNYIDAIAVTTGPGLIGGVIVGANFAKAMSMTLQKPFIAINHLEAHALTPRLSGNIKYPYLLLLISGGHCQFVLIKELGKYKILGRTLDDALGEAFDKAAQMMGLDYPGGPIIEELARTGKPTIKFPAPLFGRDGCDFSFSGLKTAVRRYVEENSPLTHDDKCNISASFQSVVVKVLCDRLKNAMKMCEIPVERVVVAGGVAANKYISDSLTAFLNEYKIEFYAPPINLCTDNAAMIAWAGIERFNKGLIDDISVKSRPRWSL